MDTRKLFQLASKLNSFIVVAEIYCKYYEDEKIMCDFCSLMTYLKQLSYDLFFEISENGDFDD